MVEFTEVSSQERRESYKRGEKLKKLLNVGGIESFESRGVSDIATDYFKL